MEREPPPDEREESAEEESAEEPVEMVIPRPYVGFIRDPFTFIGPHESFLFGLLIILLTGFIGSFTNTHFNGVLDIQTGAGGPLWVFLVPGFLNWLSLSIPLYLAGLFLTGGRTNFGAMFSYEAFARSPMLVAVLFSLVPAFQRQAAEPTVFTEDMFYFASVVLVLIGMIVLMAVWMYKGFRRAAGARGWSALVAFFVALIVGEILSQAAFYYIVGPSLALPEAAVI